ncbi:hypothetical protein [Sphingopyxis sp. L1A2A]|uniref:hypothetical protein n=1 Tax=Sphingopyxis sp. L1A2A TaxID=2502247 RepID=UPI0010F9901A|nr:hypothetical protein [Sphingopyxis sp. L1A2A]
MRHFPNRDLVRLSFPGQGERGCFLMLQGYFDDSGTHCDSSVVVWGGVMGDTEWFTKLERDWLPLLQQPIPGKPPIKQFHLSHISNGWGEFEGYNQAERDRVIKLFRDAVIRSGVIPVSFSVCVEDWNKFASPICKELYKSPEQFAFMSCVMAAHRMSDISKAPVSLQFDAARLQDSRGDIVSGAMQYFENTLVSVGFNNCAALPGLQAADMVAYEAYIYSLQSLIGDEEPRPHFKRMLEGAADAHGFILRREEIERFSEFTEAMLSGDELVRRDIPAGFQNLFHHAISGDGV